MQQIFLIQLFAKPVPKNTVDSGDVFYSQGYETSF